MKLGRLKHHYNNMATLMAALVKYADSDNTKDPELEEDKPGKGKKNGNTKGQQHNSAGHGNNGKRKADNSLHFVANTNAQDNSQRRKGKQPQRGRGSGPNLERLLNQPCPKHGSKEKPASHLWKDCFIMGEFKNSNMFQYDNGPPGGSGGGFHGPGYGGSSSGSGFQGNQTGHSNQGN